LRRIALSKIKFPIFILNFISL